MRGRGNGRFKSLYDPSDVVWYNHHIPPAKDAYHVVARGISIQRMM